MAELKTKENEASVAGFINSIEDKDKKEDARKLLKIFKEVTKQKAKMWGSSIIGFGKIHYRYESGREGDFMATGFSPRKKDFSLYISSGFEKRQNLLKKLGRHKTGKACLYISALSDIDVNVLKEIIREGYNFSVKNSVLC